MTNDSSRPNVEVAMDAIREAIARGEYAPGQRIFEVEISEELRMSRTPVREAIRRLAGEGLLELTTNKGVTVPTWSNRAIDEMFEVRSLLEGFAARLAASLATPAQIDALRGLCDDMEALERPDPTESDWDAYSILNNAFHRQLLSTSDNRQLEVSTLTLIAPALLRNRLTGHSLVLMQRSNQHHAEIVDAIAAGDESWAEAMMQAHVVSTRNRVVGGGDDAVDS